MRSIGSHGTTNISEDVIYSGVVGTYDGQTVERQVMQEFDKSRLELLDIAIVGRHVIGIYVGNNREHGFQMHE